MSYCLNTARIKYVFLPSEQVPGSLFKQQVGDPTSLLPQAVGLKTAIKYVCVYPLPLSPCAVALCTTQYKWWKFAQSQGNCIVCSVKLIYRHSVLLYSPKKTLSVNVERRLTVAPVLAQHTEYCLNLCSFVMCRALQQAISQPLTNYDEVYTVVCSMPCAAIQLAES
jgi:hypothetical protein